MYQRRLKNFMTLNHLGMSECFILRIIDKTLIMYAHHGYPSQLRVELTFTGVEYIACQIYIDDTELRLALPEETTLIHQYPHAKVFCFEEVGPPPRNNPDTFFIVAKEVEAVVMYTMETYGRTLDRVDM